MKQKPILFSTPMAQAILETRKTMTRRTPKELEIINFFPDKWEQPIEKHTVGKSVIFLFPERKKVNNLPPFEVRPQYQIGDILWVREQFRYVFHYGFTD